MEKEYPRISVITPSFNQAEFIEQTICSVIEQDYPNFEYIVQDGGSTDGSVEIIKKYEDRIDFWESGPDGGQSAAINKGFKRASGDFIMWINSDDMLAPGCLTALAETGKLKENRIVAGRCNWIDSKGEILRENHQTRITKLSELFRLWDIWFKRGGIIQPETIFCRKLFWDVGGLDAENFYCMDYELWIQMLKAGGELHKVPVNVGIFRRWEGQKVSFERELMENMCEVSRKYLEGELPLSGMKKKWLLAGVNHYEKNWRKPPPNLPVPIRKVRSALILILRKIRGY